MATDDLPILYVNHIEALPGGNEIFLSLGTELPEKFLEGKDEATVQVKPLFRCVVTKGATRAMIDAIERAYEMTLTHEELIERLRSQG